MEYTLTKCKHNESASVSFLLETDSKFDRTFSSQSIINQTNIALSGNELFYIKMRAHKFFISSHKNIIDIAYVNQNGERKKSLG